MDNCYIDNRRRDNLYYCDMKANRAPFPITKPVLLAGTKCSSVVDPIPRPRFIFGPSHCPKPPMPAPPAGPGRAPVLFPAAEKFLSLQTMLF